MNFRHLLEQHQLARQLFKTINRWLAEAGAAMTCKALWWMPPSLRHPALPEQRAATRSGDASDQERQSVASLAKAHIGVDAKSGLTPQPGSPPRPTSMTSISRVICFHGEEQFVLSRCRCQRSATARGAGRGGCGLADRRASRQGKTLKQHPRKNKKRPSTSNT